jgi:hypothetical protein
MSDSNLQPWVVTITPKSCRLRRIFNNLQKYKWNFDNSNEGPLLETLTFYLYFSGIQIVNKANFVKVYNSFVLRWLVFALYVVVVPEQILLGSIWRTL